MKTMAFGMLAFLLLLCSVCCLHYRRPRLGFVCSAVTVMLTGLTGYSWREMLLGSGSADCGESPRPLKKAPSVDEWLREAKADPSASKVGMYLTHNGVVRATAKAQVRNGEHTPAVSGMLFSYDKEKVEAAIAETYQLDGIYYVRVWLNEGTLAVGDDIMFVLIGGDIRSHIVDALNYLVGTLKNMCVSEKELFENVDPQ